jgi:hypothetical protein
MLAQKTTRTHYSESEAAEALGVSVEQLRALIKNYVVVADEDLTNVPNATFQPSDLLLLRILSGLQVNSSNPI